MNPNFQGAWIPRNIYTAKHLSWSEKILLVEIKELDRDERGCYAGNKHLAEHLNVTPGAAANMVSKLRQSGEIIELWTDGKNRGLRIDFERLEELENEHLEKLKKKRNKRKAPSQIYEGSSQIYEASPQKYEGSPEKDENASQKNEASPQKNTEASQIYEASEEKTDSEPSYIYEHSSTKGFSTKQLENTHSTTEGAGDKPPPEKTAAAAVCGTGENPKKKKRRKSDMKRPRSEFSLFDCLRYAEACKRRGENIHNPKGLARTLYQTGEADAFIKAELFPERTAEDFPEPVEFTDEPCSKCFGAKMEIVDGLGARPCLHCWNERDQPTGREPKGDP